MAYAISVAADAGGVGPLAFRRSGVGVALCGGLLPRAAALLRALCFGVQSRPPAGRIVDIQCRFIAKNQVDFVFISCPWANVRGLDPSIEVQ